MPAAPARIRVPPSRRAAEWAPCRPSRPLPVEGGTAPRVTPALGRWVAVWAGLGLVTVISPLTGAPRILERPRYGVVSAETRGPRRERSAPRRDTGTAVAVRAEHSTDAVPRHRRSTKAVPRNRRAGLSEAGRGRGRGPKSRSPANPDCNGRTAARQGAGSTPYQPIPGRRRPSRPRTPPPESERDRTRTTRGGALGPTKGTRIPSDERTRPGCLDDSVQ
jgi:hypothetical protein